MKKTRRRWTKEMWLDLNADMETSGLKKACEIHEIQPSFFYVLKKRFGKTNGNGSHKVQNVQNLQPSGVRKPETMTAVINQAINQEVRRRIEEIYQKLGPIFRGE